MEHAVKAAAAAVVTHRVAPLATPPEAPPPPAAPPAMLPAGSLPSLALAPRSVLPPAQATPKSPAWPLSLRPTWRGSPSPYQSRPASQDRFPLLFGAVCPPTCPSKHWKRAHFLVLQVLGLWGASWNLKGYVCAFSLHHCLHSHWRYHCRVRLLPQPLLGGQLSQHHHCSPDSDCGSLLASGISFWAASPLPCPSFHPCYAYLSPWICPLKQSCFFPCVFLSRCPF
mmetsp:Transcript_130167/g.324560  ORF Transcript_130167/g.324560 Transcript_130167/m.324560 type:complete len:226 (-) Transcript_130167:474-1151(-)